MRNFEDVRKQVDRVTDAQLVLADSLDRLARVAKGASRGRERLEDVYGAVNAVRRAEEAHDLAALDLSTARGEDA